MFSALFSFLGGSAFRMIWGEVSSYFTAKQSHKQELERLQIQGQLDAAAHERNLAAIKLQAEMGVKTIQVQAEADASRMDVQAFVQAVTDVGKKTGILFIDVWNGIVRPALATVAISVLIAEVVNNNGAPTAHVLAVCDAILGMYVADRSLAKRGK